MIYRDRGSKLSLEDVVKLRSASGIRSADDKRLRMVITGQARRAGQGRWVMQSTRIDGRARPNAALRRYRDRDTTAVRGSRRAGVQRTTGTVLSSGVSR